MLKTGSEALSAQGISLPFTLLDFWRWAGSDTLSNATRGELAEFIVATALDLPLKGCREDWGVYDLETIEGLKLEIKSAAYLQSWHQQKPSDIKFGTAPTRAWLKESMSYDKAMRRQADLYVFCLLHHLEKATVDPLNMDQWCFYIVPTQTLDKLFPTSKSISLKALRALGSSLSYPQLKPAIVAQMPQQF